MVFSSTVFLFLFLPVVYLVNLIFRGKGRNWWLLAASLFFYAWGEPVYVLIMAGCILTNYVIALQIGRSAAGARKAWLAAAVAANLLALVVFKYTNFIVDNINAATGWGIYVQQISLPVGISFFTFQAISYVVDVYRGQTDAQKRLPDLALYIAFFPQLIAGPIVKYHDIAAQIETRTMTVEKTLSGLQRFTVGLSKKLLLANALGQMADAVYALGPAGTNLPVAWIGAIAYTLQIYMDFSGYSDMAIGLGRMFGFEIMENFKHPFISGSIKEFWRRWHISLSTWFREYLYIPLGGNRKGLLRTCLNMTVVFLCTGFWHGAEWTFLVWGLFHGTFLILETLGVIRPQSFRFKWLGNLYALLIVVVGFTVFRAETIAQGFGMVAALFTGFSFDAAHLLPLGSLLSPVRILVLAVAVAASFPVLPWVRQRLSASGKSSSKALYAVGLACTAVLLVLCLLSLASSTYNPFIYYRF
jgi:alginate O-acetyltransferase complex protein AlgI